MNYEHGLAQPFEAVGFPGLSKESNDRADSKPRLWPLWVASWGALGVSAVFVESVFRLGSRAIATAVGLTVPQFVVFAGVAALFCYVEGYRALQKRFVPHVVERLLEVSRRGGRLRWRVLAPLFALSLVGGDTREFLRGWATVLAIVAAIGFVRHLPSPWRGVVDGGVALALAWGTLALVAQFIRVIPQLAKERA